MVVIDRSSFVVIDLDDTLFAEADYERSGLLAVAATVRELFDIDVEQKLLRWHDVGAPDVFGWLATHLGLHPAAKESFLWTYRLHRPAIVLADSVAATLADLRQVAAGIPRPSHWGPVPARRK